MKATHRPVSKVLRRKASHYLPEAMKRKRRNVRCRRNQGCSPEIAETPHTNRAKTPSSVQRESGNEIKEGKHGH